MSLVQALLIFSLEKKSNCIKLFLDVLPKALLRCFLHKMFAPCVNVNYQVKLVTVSQGPARVWGSFVPNFR